MAFTIADFADLERLLAENPEWRVRLRPLILGEELLLIPSRMDRVEATLDRLAEGQAATEVTLDRLAERQAATEATLDRLAERQAATEATLDRLAEGQAALEAALTRLAVTVEETTRQFAERFNAIEGRAGNIEGELLELRFDRNLPNWVRHVLRRPTRVYVDDLDPLVAASEAGTLSEADMTSLAALDSMVRGIDRASGLETILAVEISATVNIDDVERAAARAALLRRAGLEARPMVTGLRISPAAEQLATEHGVIVTLHRPAA